MMTARPHNELLRYSPLQSTDRPEAVHAHGLMHRYEERSKSMKTAYFIEKAGNEDSDLCFLHIRDAHS